MNIDGAKFYLLLKKEILLVLRDKSVLFANLILPLLLGPLIIILFSDLTKLDELKKQKAQNKPFSITYQGQADPILIEHLKETLEMPISLLQDHPSDEDQLQLFLLYKQIAPSLRNSERTILDLNGEKVRIIDAIAQISRAKNTILSKTKLHLVFADREDNTKSIIVLYEKGDEDSTRAFKRLDPILEEYKDNQVIFALKEKMVTMAEIIPLSVETMNLFDLKSLINIIGLIIGIVIVFLLILSTYTPSFGMTIGERDHQTYKTILMNPVTLTEIFLSKFICLTLLGIFSLIPYLIQYILFSLLMDSPLFLINDILSFGGFRFVWFILLLISINFIVSALTFFFSSFARTQGQAQVFLSTLMILLILPVAAGAYLNLELNLLTSLIPVTNFTLSLGNLFSENPAYLPLINVLLTNTILSLLIFRISVSSFSVQWKGSSDSKGLSDLLNFKNRKTRTLVPGHAYLSFALVFLGLIYLKLIYGDNLNYIILYTPGLVFIMIGLSVLWYSQLKLREILKINKQDSVLKEGASTLLLAIIGAGVWIVLGPPQKALFPPINDLSLFEQLLYVIFSVIAIEFFFRSILYQALRTSYHFLPAILLTAAATAVTTLSSTQIPWTFAGAVVLAFVYEKRGFLSCLLTHFFFKLSLIVYTLL